MVRVGRILNCNYHLKYIFMKKWSLENLLIGIGSISGIGCLPAWGNIHDDPHGYIKATAIILTVMAAVSWFVYFGKCKFNFLNKKK